jgi:hypothetical protein
MDIPFICELIEYVDNLPPDTAFHAKNFAVGLISGALLLAQRGGIDATTKDENGVSIAPERSLAYQLSKRIPGYAHISPLIDHALESAVYVFWGGGTLGLAKSLVGDIDHNNLYSTGIIIGLVKKTGTELITYSYGRPSIGDVAQTVTDVATMYIFKGLVSK